MKKIFIPFYKGSIKVVYDNEKIYGVEYTSKVKLKIYDDDISKAFQSYVKGDPEDFTEFTLNFNGLTEFQIRVYNLLRKIPYGNVRSYKWVARKLDINSPRAVGQALKRNPFLIVVPCHRIVKTNGELGGFISLHGTQLKKFLLQLEGIDINNLIHYVENHEP